jgi:hypothetical protein
MKKPVAIALAFLFNFTVLLPGASGYSDCAAKCSRQMAKAHQHASMGPASLAAPNCCSAAMKNTCEMGMTVEVKIPEFSMAGHHTHSPEPIGIGFVSNDTESDLFGRTQSNRRFITGEIKPKIPLYLKKLALLC